MFSSDICIIFWGEGEGVEASPVLKAFHRGLEIKISYFYPKIYNFFQKMLCLFIKFLEIDPDPRSGSGLTKKPGTGP